MGDRSTDKTERQNKDYEDDLVLKQRSREYCSRLVVVQLQGIHGEHTESVGGVYDISNKRRLGLTEFDALSEMANGIKAIIAEEKKLMGGQQTKK